MKKENKNHWDFLEEFLPDYSSSDRVALAQDLQMMLDGDFSDDRLLMFRDDYDSSVFEVKQEFNRLMSCLLKEAITNYYGTRKV